MRLKNKDLAAFPKTWPPKADVALIYGPDQGLVRERAEALMGLFIEDLRDPFRVIDLSENEYRSDPTRLRDEFAALAMLGGRRIVRLRLGSERTSAAIKAFIVDLDRGSIPGDALVVIEAGDLPPSSTARKAAEAAKRTVAIPCYIDDDHALRAYIRRTLSDNGLEISNDTATALAARLGNDRGVTRQELEKLVLFKSNPDGSTDNTVSEDDIDAVIAEANVLNIEDLCYTAGLGQIRSVEPALDRCFLDGTTPPSVIRALIHHLDRIYASLATMESGVSAKEAMQTMRPRIHFKRAAAFEKQLSQWTGARCSTAIRSLYEDEIAAKNTGSPAQAICRRAALRIAQLANAA